MRKILAVIIAVISINNLFAQQVKLSKEDIAAYDIEIRQMMKFLESTFNFIGDTTSLPDEKEIIFNESYIKVFKDENVQIEDDLDENRAVSVSKEVQAYLKDIDFFFKSATFRFDIVRIQNLLGAGDGAIFKVEMIRHLHGITINNDTVDNMKQRFVEINLDPKNNGLKIASIYTSHLDETEDLCVWWNSLTTAWRTVLARDITVNDSISLRTVTNISKTSFKADYPVKEVQGNDTIISEWREGFFKSDMTEIFNRLRTICQTRFLNLQGNKGIDALDPLLEFPELSSLNMSGTSVTDLSPLRNANKLKNLNASNTNITDLSPLRYCNSLQDIDVSSTQVKDLEVLYMLNNVEKLNISNTKVTDIGPAAACTNMTHLIFKSGNISNIEPIKNLDKLLSLDISGSRVSNINDLGNITKLQSLNISGTQVTDISVLSKMENLKELYCSNTGIRNIQPLTGLRKLSRIYCDNTAVSATEASNFAKENSRTLIIYDTDALKDWWQELPLYWKSIFSQQVSISSDPTTEELHAIINMKSLDLHDNTYIQNLQPVSRLTALETLNISNTEIIRLDPLFGMTSLQSLNLENTYISSLKPLEISNSLRVLNISNSQVEDLDPLENINTLEIIIATNSLITTDDVMRLKEKHPNVTVIYQTQKLETWWANLDTTWKAIMKEHVPIRGINPTEFELQRMVDLRKIEIKTEEPIMNLEPIASFEWVETLNVANQGINDLKPLSKMTHLKELYVQDNPITDFTPIQNIYSLEILNVSNTGIDNLDVVAQLRNLRILNAGGTIIKSLKPLGTLTKIEELIVNNTPLKSLVPVDKMPSLKTLKIYNTKITMRVVEDLQKKRFDLNIIYY